MEPTPGDIERYIADGLDCEVVKVSGDGRHFEALIVSSAFEGQSLVSRVTSTSIARSATACGRRFTRCRCEP